MVNLLPLEPWPLRVCRRFQIINWFIMCAHSPIALAHNLPPFHLICTTILIGIPSVADQRTVQGADLQRWAHGEANVELHRGDREGPEEGNTPHSWYQMLGHLRAGVAQRKRYEKWEPREKFGLTFIDKKEREEVLWITHHGGLR